MGSRSKGPRREVVTFQYYKSVDPGPRGEGKLARRSRRMRRTRYGRALEQQWAMKHRARRGKK